MTKAELFQALDDLEGVDHHARNETLARTGRWGTCADCPVVDGVVQPEGCEHALRYDHQFSVGPAARVLVDAYRAGLQEPRRLR